MMTLHNRPPRLGPEIRAAIEEMTRLWNTDTPLEEIAKKHRVSAQSLRVNLRKRGLSCHERLKRIELEAKQKHLNALWPDIKIQLDETDRTLKEIADQFEISVGSLREITQQNEYDMKERRSRTISVSMLKRNGRLREEKHADKPPQPPQLTPSQALLRRLWV